MRRPTFIGGSASPGLGRGESDRGKLQLCALKAWRTHEREVENRNGAGRPVGGPSCKCRCNANCTRSGRRPFKAAWPARSSVGWPPKPCLVAVMAIQKKKTTVGGIGLPDAQAFLIDALSSHIRAYGGVANTEAGFDLGIKPQQVVVGAPDGYAVVFATITSDACKRLTSLDGVQPTLKKLTAIRRERLRSSCYFGRIDKSEKLIDTRGGAAVHDGNHELLKAVRHHRFGDQRASSLDQHESAVNRRIKIVAHIIGVIAATLVRWPRTWFDACSIEVSCTAKKARLRSPLSARAMGRKDKTTLEICRDASNWSIVWSQIGLSRGGPAEIPARSLCIQRQQVSKRRTIWLHCTCDRTRWRWIALGSAVWVFEL